MKRVVVYISDGTGLTAEILGHSILSQFNGVEFEKLTLPYIQDRESAQKAVIKINEVAEEYNTVPIVFSTLVIEEHRDLIKQSRGFVLDAFGTFLGPLEEELGVRSSLKVGQSHSIQNPKVYRARIEAVHFALENDDGGSRPRHYEQADIILVGLARTGKTPTSLYLALHYGLFAANYPLTEKDFAREELPEVLQPHLGKLFGLTVDPSRLAATRKEQKKDSNYSSAEQCEFETEGAEAFFSGHNIPFLNASELSVEEISTRLIAATKVKRRLH
ncbi:MAG TPA: pyruvate, water dikinase regulatory protein [Alcanivoracaceae bacterium]|nr:pyruvate, water dikinase regulatory protein [Alcanivoracaceae bacterium]